MIRVRAKVRVSVNLTLTLTLIVYQNVGNITALNAFLYKSEVQIQITKRGLNVDCIKAVAFFGSAFESSFVGTTFEVRLQQGSSVEDTKQQSACQLRSHRAMLRFAPSQAIAHDT